MKVLLIGNSVNGHRLKYITYLKNIEKLYDKSMKFDVYVLSNKGMIYENVIETDYCQNRSLRSYIDLLLKIRNIIKKNNYDIIHFLDGDEYYKFGGIFLSVLGSIKKIITFHHLFTSGLKKFLILKTMGKFDSSVVHTDTLFSYFSKFISEKKIFKVDYPVFIYDDILDVDKTKAKQKLNLQDKKIVIGILGGQSDYKGTDLFLQAMNNVSGDFFVVIAGRSIGNFTESYLKSFVENYNDKIRFEIKDLSELEYINYLKSFDIIVFPYRKKFDGASGPLLESIVAGKVVIGANHGSMGAEISRYSRGITFESENVNDLSLVINKVLDKYESLICNDIEMEKKILEPKLFQEKYYNIYNSIGE